jgi:hypothetical protein
MESASRLMGANAAVNSATAADPSGARSRATFTWASRNLCTTPLDGSAPPSCQAADHRIEQRMGVAGGGQARRHPTTQIGRESADSKATC